jgi:hypothetical protein
MSQIAWMAGLGRRAACQASIKRRGAISPAVGTSTNPGDAASSEAGNSPIPCPRATNPATAAPNGTRTARSNPNPGACNCRACASTDAATNKRSPESSAGLETHPNPATRDPARANTTNASAPNATHPTPDPATETPTARSARPRSKQRTNSRSSATSEASTATPSARSPTAANNRPTNGAKSPTNANRTARSTHPADTDKSIRAARNSANTSSARPANTAPTAVKRTLRCPRSRSTNRDPTTRSRCATQDITHANQPNPHTTHHQTLRQTSRARPISPSDHLDHANTQTGQ